MGRVYPERRSFPEGQVSSERRFFPEGQDYPEGQDSLEGRSFPEKRRFFGGMLRFRRRFPFRGLKAALPDSLSLSLPTGVLGRTPYLSLRGQEELEIYGCVSILCYEEEKILLKLTKGCLRIVGKSLTMRTYHRNSMTVGGRILCIDFPPEDGTETDRGEAKA